VALVATILKFANIDTLIAFLIANLLFWLIDLLGNILGKLSYRRLDLESIKHQHPEVYRWVNKEIRQWYKGPFYSCVNLIFFGLALLGALAFGDRKAAQMTVAALVFLFTLVRHLFLRTII